MGATWLRVALATALVLLLAATAASASRYEPAYEDPEWVCDSTEAPAGAVFDLFGKGLNLYTEVDVFDPPPLLAS